MAAIQEPLSKLRVSTAHKSLPSVEEQSTRQIGVSRPPLVVEDLPTPEEVFRTKRIGLEELAVLVLGPALIALAISIEEGEWLLGPLYANQHGMQGLGWVILISAMLQVFYNVELARFTLATGETPLVAFGRTPPGYFIWVPFALLLMVLVFILGEWAVLTGSSLFTLLTGNVPLHADRETVRLWSMLLMGGAFLILMIGRKIERTLEGVLGIILPYVLIGILFIAVVIVPRDYWLQSFESLLIPDTLPQNLDISILGSFAGFTALAAGLNFMVMAYYRDKGYGMGHKTGFISGWLGGSRSKILPVGRIFPESEVNTIVWKRWFRYLIIDQWGIFFIGTLVSMFIPLILVNFIASSPFASKPDATNIMVYLSQQLGRRYGPLLAGWTLLSGFAIFLTTQIGILDLMARNFTDVLLTYSLRIRQRLNDEPRKLYYISLVGIVVIVSLAIHIDLPTVLSVLSANLMNLAAMVFPLLMIYLNRQLPKPARISWWSYLVLLANFLFFGFFFVNYLSVLLNGAPLLRF